MFDKLNIFINNEKKEEKIKNIFTDIFADKYEITFLIYLSWIFYQILKLIWGFKVSPIFWNLYFFSFANTINDFWIIFWYSFILFTVSWLVIIILNYMLHKFNIKDNKKLSYILSIIPLLLVCIAFYQVWTNIFEIKNSLLLIPYIIWTISSFILLKYKKSLKKQIYISFWLFFFYWFLILLYWSWKYYWCENINIIDLKKECILFDYKNDKYWFTWSWDIYDINQFKSFYTYDYLEKLENFRK